MTYAEQLKHPKWQEKRLRVLSCAGFKCERCGSGERTLHAHHKVYLKGHKLWEYEDALLECLCETCHSTVHAQLAELEWIIGHEPTSALPMITDSVTAALANGRADASLPPKIRDAFSELGRALGGSDETALVNAQNRLQDLVNEFRDLRRGPGGAWRKQA